MCYSITYMSVIEARAALRQYAEDTKSNRVLDPHVLKDTPGLFPPYRAMIYDLINRPEPLVAPGVPVPGYLRIGLFGPEYLLPENFSLRPQDLHFSRYIKHPGRSGSILASENPEIAKIVHMGSFRRPSEFLYAVNAEELTDIGWQILYDPRPRGNVLHVSVTPQVPLELGDIPIKYREQIVDLLQQNQIRG